MSGWLCHRRHLPDGFLSGTAGLASHGDGGGVTHWMAWLQRSDVDILDVGLQLWQEKDINDQDDDDDDDDNDDEQDATAAAGGGGP